MKAGITSTEFWLLLLVVGLSTAAQAVGVVLGEEHEVVRIILIVSGAVGQVASALGYAVTRSGVKKEQLKAGTAALLLLSVLCLAGCESMPMDKQWAIAAGTYSGTLETLTSLKKLGYLDDEDKAAIEPVRASARAAVDEMERAAFSSDPEAEVWFGKALTAWKTAIAAMTAWVANAAKPEGGGE
ncbi:MAG TPA: hypothetical protein VFH61_02150 [Thermoleophilia bacterium]|nr:hypothetical protein [Thermoleophilia bacterium]